MTWDGTHLSPIERAASAAGRAVWELARIDRPAILRAIAAAADAFRAEIIATTAEETALTPDELAPEFDRMVGTLRMFADLVAEGSWVRAALDPRGTPTPARIGPDNDVRSLLIPLGPVAVFGASNFPLAYGVLGGDTASALAAGCPVVVKEHPAHPRTGRLLAEVAREAIRGVNPDVVKDEPWDQSQVVLSYVRDEQGDPAVGRELVTNSSIAGVGFTGSREGGLALAKLGLERDLPIPVFSEMGSANRVVICPGALKNRGAAIAAELAASILSRHGQQCTKPGLIFLHQDPVAGPAFVAELARLLDAAPSRRMLSLNVAERYANGCRRLRLIPHVKLATSRTEPDLVVDDERHTVPMLYAAMDQGTAQQDLDGLQMFTPGGAGYWLNDEIFGPAAVVIGADGFENGYYADPCLATTIYADPEDMDDLVQLNYDTDTIESLSYRANHALHSTGRLAFNSPTTGVRVATAMVHGGPYPATNRPDTTAVGPRAIERWCRTVCFQNCPDALLPPELQNANPRAILRTVNGVPMRDPIPGP